MARRIRLLVAALVILSIIACMAPSALAFSFTDISKAGVQWQGTKTRPVTVSSEADALGKYMRLRGINLGKMYYKRADGSTIDQRKLSEISRTAYPFLMLVTCWYEYEDMYPYDPVYYIEMAFYTPEYAEPAVKKAEELAARIAGPEKGYMERLRAIHEYLIDNVEYDWKLYGKKYPDAKDVGYTAYGALINGKAVCEGYSSAFALLCHAAGIPAYMATGENPTGPHSWNLVYLYGSFYHVDVTGCDTTGERYRYFMLTERELLTSHKIDSSVSRAVITSLHSAELPSAQLLSELGLLRGAGSGFDLDRGPSRLDAAVMLTRLTGREEEALLRSYGHPFTDVPDWASPYIGYLYRYGLTTGTTADRYGGAKTAGVNDYLTFMLRALGYSDAAGDFTWSESVAAAERLGLVPRGKYRSGATITRGDMAAISLKTLLTKRANGTYLLDSLVNAGVVDKARADGVAEYMPAR